MGSAVVFVAAIAVGVGAALSGCSGTCIRHSDCDTGKMCGPAGTCIDPPVAGMDGGEMPDGMEGDAIAIAEDAAVGDAAVEDAASDSDGGEVDGGGTDGGAGDGDATDGATDS